MTFLQKNGLDLAALTFSFVICGSAVAQPIVDEVCADTTLSGRVSAGEFYEGQFSDSLRFVLEPTSGPPNPEGWTMRVIGENPQHDFLMIATPPYRFSNPRDLDTSYGKTAEQVTAWTPRSFQFVLNDRDFEAMNRAVGTLLWPADKSEGELEAARRVHSDTRKASGLFRILSSEISTQTDQSPLGRIEDLSFEVELCREEGP